MSFEKNIGDSQVTGDFTLLEKLIENLGINYYVDIGILGQATYEDGATIAGIGAVHEFGRVDGSIPQRSFIRMPLEVKQEQITKKVEAKLEELLAAGDIEGIFKAIGVAGEEAIQEAFETGGFGTWEDIQEATKKRKGSSAILIDRGDLRKAITWEVGE